MSDGAADGRALDPSPAEAANFVDAALAALPLVSALAVDTDLRYREVIGSDVVKHGYDPRSLIGCRVQDVIPAETWVQVEPLFLAALEGRTGVQVLGTDLPYGWYEATYSPIADADGTIIGCLTTVRDVTAETDARRDLERVRARHELLAANMGDVVALVDPDGVTSYVSPSCARVLGWQPEQMVGRPIRDFAHPPDVADVQPARQELTQGQDELTRQHRMRRADGSLVWVEVRMRAIRGQSGSLEGIVVTIRDVSERHQLGQELAGALGLLERTFDATPIGTGVMTSAGEWTRVNRALCGMVGLDERALLHAGLAGLARADDVDRVLAVVRQVARGSLARGTVDVDVPDRGLGTTTLEVGLTRLGGRDDADGQVVLTVEDVTLRRLERANLRIQAETDPLTGLWNRRRLDADLQAACAADRCPVLLHIDLDGFKAVNDRLGHEVGDDHLRQVGVLLRAATRTSDMVARIGGDEFTAILWDTDPSRTAGVVERIMDGIEALGMGTRASVGVALRQEGEMPREWMRRADEAMYVGKRAGGGRATVAATDGVTVPFEGRTALE